MRNNSSDSDSDITPVRPIHTTKKQFHFCRCVWGWMILSGILICLFDFACIMLSISNPSWVSDYYIIMWAKYGTGIIPCATLLGFIIWHL